jgi:hypothetical protein
MRLQDAPDIVHPLVGSAVLCGAGPGGNHGAMPVPSC